jgi:beta-lactamase regulating signal transducer with metallopeptidase domain
MIEWLLDTLLYTGLLIGLVLLLRRPVARAFGPQIAYALWALPLLRLLLPPIVLPASLAPQPEPADAVPLLPTSADIAGIDSAAPPAAEPIFALAWSDILVPLWLGGAMVFLALRIHTYRRMRRAVLAEARPVGEVGPILLVETPALAAPVAFGVLSKVIALPPLFMAQRDRTARDLAIAHELAHHRGHDLAANFAAQALLALHWFNPIAWLGWRAMRHDQEAACDARVLAGHSREERARYAALIAGLAAGPRLALVAPMACPVLGEASIVHRLQSLSRQDLSPRRRRLGSVLLGAGALALPLTASISYAAQPQAERALALPSPLPAPAPPLPHEAVQVAEAPELPEAPQLSDLPEPPDPVEAPELPSDPSALGAFEARMEHFASRMAHMVEQRAEQHKRMEREAERIEWGNRADGP